MTGGGSYTAPCVVASLYTDLYAVETTPDGTVCNLIILNANTSDVYGCTDDVQGMGASDTANAALLVVGEFVVSDSFNTNNDLFQFADEQQLYRM